jgi:hypothetical protein
MHLENVILAIISSPYVPGNFLGSPDSINSSIY